MDDAVRLGTDAVGYTLYVGTPAHDRDFEQYRRCYWASPCPPTADPSRAPHLLVGTADCGSGGTFDFLATDSKSESNTWNLRSSRAATARSLVPPLGLTSIGIFAALVTYAALHQGNDPWIVGG